jgi:hypothetical protein
MITANLDRSGAIHFMPNDGRRFPLCGSWRSNWNYTADPESATCEECRARLTPSQRVGPPPRASDEKP